MEFAYTLWNFLSNTILKIFWNKKVTIAILGLDNAGKTTLLAELNGDVVISPSVTRHTSMYELKYNNLTICAYDLAGQITKRRVWEQFFPIVDGIVFMVDASDKQRFEEAKNELQNLLKNPMISNVPILVLGNKIDLPSAVDELTLREALGLQLTSGKNMPKTDGMRSLELFMCSVVARQGYKDGSNQFVREY